MNSFLKSNYLCFETIKEKASVIKYSHLSFSLDKMWMQKNSSLNFKEISQFKLKYSILNR